MSDNMNTLAIWWLSEADCRQIGEPHYIGDYDVDNPEEMAEYERLSNMVGVVDLATLPIPDYLKPEYNSRYGRAGRGRLWVPEAIDLEGIEWADTKEGFRRATECGGLVFYRYDLDQIQRMPGFVTDTQGNILETTDHDR